MDTQNRPAPGVPGQNGGPPQAASLFQELLVLLLKVSAIILVFSLVFTFIYGLHRSDDASMSPAIRDGDLLLVYRLYNAFAAGDVLLLEIDGQRQVRRVVAVEGDVVDISEEGLVVNGALQQEPEIYQPTQRYADGIAFPITLGAGQVFVLADARENATDSRVYGPVDAEDVLGKVISILWRRQI